MTALSTNILLKPRLLGLWIMGDAGGSTTFADSSGAGHNPTLHGGITLGATGLAASDATKAATFNGTSGYASFASGVFDFEYTDLWTVEALINLSSAPAEAMLIAKQDDSGSYTGWNVALRNVAANTYVIEAGVFHEGATPPLKMVFVNGSQNMTVGTTYHIVVSYDGSGTAAGFAFWVNGVIDPAIVVRNNSLSGLTIKTATVANIGARGGTGSPDVFLPATGQYLALYGASGPGSISTQGGYGNMLPYNIVTPADYHIGLLALAPPSDPSVPNVIMDTDFGGDVDDAYDLWIMCIFHLQGKLRLVGVTTSTSQVDGASAVQAFLNYWGILCPVYAYQGTATPSPDFWGSTVAAQFVAGDATNKGCTAVASIVGGGTLYAVGDVLTVPGGVVASGRLGRATTLTVAAVTAGVITSFSISDSGSYSTFPPGTAGVVTLPNPHSGTPATVTLTSTARRGNYTNALSGLRQLCNTYSNLWLLEDGFLINYAALLASASNAGGDGLGSGATLLTNNSIAMVIASGFSPGNVAWGVGAEYNYSSDPASSNAIVAGSPVWPKPIVDCGIELTNPNYGSATGLIDIKPSSTALSATNPLQLAYLTYKNGGHPLDAQDKRIFYSFAALIFLGEGMAGGRLYWRSIGISETINASTGVNSETFSAGTPSWSSLGKKDTDANYATWGTTLLDTNSVASGTGAAQLLLLGVS